MVQIKRELNNNNQYFIIFIFMRFFRPGSWSLEWPVVGVVLAFAVIIWAGGEHFKVLPASSRL